MINQYLGYALSAFVLLVHGTSVGGETRRDDLRVRRAVELTAALLIALGLYARWVSVQSMAAGEYLFEEVSALGYVGDLFLGNPTLTGFTNLTFFLVSAGWQWTFGTGLSSTRWLTEAVCVLAVVVLYRAVRRLTDRETALFTAAFSAVSVVGVHFSAMAIETAWPLLFAAANLYGYAIISAVRRKTAFCFVGGVITACGCLTYPGYHLWLASLLPAAAVIVPRREPRWLKFGGALLAGFSLVMIPVYTLQRMRQAQAPFLRGGGAVFSSPGDGSFWSCLRVHLEDIFGRATSYYLPQTAGFVESALLGFCALGVFSLVWRQRRPWALVLLSSMVLLPFLSAAITNTPGMRRAILVLPMFYIFAGYGARHFVRSRRGSCFAWFAVVGLVGGGVVLNSAWTLGRTIRLNASRPPFSPVAELLTAPQFASDLRRDDVTVVLHDAGPYADYTRKFLLAFAHLQTRFARRPDRDFAVLRPTDEAVVPRAPGAARVLYFEREETRRRYGKFLCLSEPSELGFRSGTIYRAVNRDCPAFYR